MGDFDKPKMVEDEAAVDALQDCGALAPGSLVRMDDTKPPLTSGFTPIRTC